MTQASPSRGHVGTSRWPEALALERGWPTSPCVDQISHGCRELEIRDSGPRPPLPFLSPFPAPPAEVRDSDKVTCGHMNNAPCIFSPFIVPHGPGVILVFLTSLPLSIFYIGSWQMFSVQVLGINILALGATWSLWPSLESSTEEGLYNV